MCLYKLTGVPSLAQQIELYYARHLLAGHGSGRKAYAATVTFLSVTVLNSLNCFGNGLLLRGHLLPSNRRHL